MTDHIKQIEDTLERVKEEIEHFKEQDQMWGDRTEPSINKWNGYIQGTVALKYGDLLVFRDALQNMKDKQ
jgi:hypothetical protein